MSILFEKDGLVFSILRNDFKKFIVLGEYGIGNISELFSFRERIPGEFGVVNMAFRGGKVTLIPKSLFEAVLATQFASFQFDVEDEIILFDELQHQDLVVLYSIPQSLKQLADNAFGNGKIKHAGSFSIEYYLSKYKNKPGEHMFANLWHNKVEVTVIKNGELVLYNIFDYQTNEDLLYALLNVYEQLPMSPEIVPLKLSGEIKKESDAWKLLETYIRYVEAEQRPEAYQFSHEFKLMAPHIYNKIFQIATCAL